MLNNMFLNNVFHLIVLMGVFISLIQVFKPYVKQYLQKLRLESEFLDFLSIVLIMEASGLRLDVVFEEGSKGNILLPKSFSEIARKYVLLSKINPDPYTCIRLLSKKVSSDRVSRFFEGYSEVLITTNDTLSYVESFIREEIRGLHAKIENYAMILDTIYESYLIILLGILTYFMLPFTPISPVIFGFLLSIFSLSAFIMIYKLSDLTMYSNGTIYVFPTLLLVFSTPLIILVYPDMIIFHLFLTVLLGILLCYLFRNMLLLEDKIVFLLEDLYAGVRHGLSIDHALILVGEKYGFPINKLSDLLKLGIKSYEITKSLKLPPLPKRVIDLILAPMEYTSGVPRYFGYVLNIVESVRGLRKALAVRGRIYFIYVLVLLATVVVMYNLMKRFSVGVIDPGLVKGLTYTCVFESVLMASIISRGYWFKNFAGYFILFVSIIVLEIFI